MHHPSFTDNPSICVIPIRIYYLDNTRSKYWPRQYSLSARQSHTLRRQDWPLLHRWLSEHCRQLYTTLSQLAVQKPTHPLRFPHCLHPLHARRSQPRLHAHSQPRHLGRHRQRRRNHSIYNPNAFLAKTTKVGLHLGAYRHVNRSGLDQGPTLHNTNAVPHPFITVKIAPISKTDPANRLTIMPLPSSLSVFENQCPTNQTRTTLQIPRELYSTFTTVAFP